MDTEILNSQFIEVVATSDSGNYTLTHPRKILIRKTAVIALIDHSQSEYRDVSTEIVLSCSDDRINDDEGGGVLHGPRILCVTDNYEAIAAKLGYTRNGE